MDEMREIVTMDQANRLFLVLALSVPITCVAIGAALGVRKGEIARGASFGLLIGLIGPANLLLWKVYNAITDRLGLDTVRNLIVNLTLFVVLGVVAGLIIGRWAHRSAPVNGPTGSPESASSPPDS